MHMDYQPRRLCSIGQATRYTRTYALSCLLAADINALPKMINSRHATQSCRGNSRRAAFGYIRTSDEDGPMQLVSVDRVRSLSWLGR
jgi:hypothetical protein